MEKNARCRWRTCRLILLAALSACNFALSSSRAAENDPIVLTLREKATVSGSQVRIKDIADLQGTDKSECERLGRLDLAELPLTSEPIVVTQQQIGFRLQLAGLAADSYRLEGPRCVRVSRPAGEGLDAKIVAVARSAVKQKLSAQEDDVSIEVAQEVTIPPLSANDSDIHLEAEVRSQLVPPCRAAVEVAIFVRGARRNGVIVYLDVKKLQMIPVAVRRIDSGEVFSADNVRMERIALENTQKTAVAAAGFLGRHARRPVFAGRPLESDDVEGDTSTTIVIRANALVHLIAAVGPLQVKTRGEALQDGRVGQPIQVRNLDSKNIVTGRVVDGSTVEVDY